MNQAGVTPARIEFGDWGWRYAARDAWAVRGLDLVVEPGERVAVVGASGAGKSTLLRAVAAVLPDEPDADDHSAASVQGSVTVDGAAPGSARGRVGLVMQDPEAHTVMSRVGDDVAFGCENLGVPRAAIWERVRSALEVVGLALPLDRSTTMLSGGQRQRLALAGVLAMRPGAVVLDEPCANLDPDGVRQVHDAVRALLDDTGATMLVVEHRIGTWLDLVDRLVLLAPGAGVLADGPPAEVLREHGAALTAAGVWVPGADPARGSARRPRPAPTRAGEMPGQVAAGTRVFRPLGGDAAGAAPGMGAPAPTRAGEMPGPVPKPSVVFRPLGAAAPPDAAPAAAAPAAAAPAAAAPAAAAPAVELHAGADLLVAEELGTARSRRHPVGHGIDLTVRGGEVLAVTGPNGIGKSTLGLTLAGLLRPAVGTLRATTQLISATAAPPAGPAPCGWSSRQLAARIGTVFQDPEHQFVARTVRQELAAGPTALGTDPDEVAARVDDLLQTFGLVHLADADPFTLSGGEQRRLAIGTVVATRPPVIVLDEPTSGQDRATWQAVAGALGALADAGTAIVAVTHDRDLVRALDARELVLTATGLTDPTTRTAP
ncbi:ATP-binding cassette domain-containing protein [Microbacterium sp. M1A1_1b]